MQSFGVWKRRPILNHSDHCASADGCMISFQVDEISLATEMCKVHIIFATERVADANKKFQVIFEN